MLATETITSREMLERLSKLKAATPATIVTETKPAVKAGSPEIVKRSEVNGMLQANYEASVNRVREKQGEDADFKAGKLPWGIRFLDSCIFVHKPKNAGEFRAYLRVQVQGTKKPQYFLNGTQIPEEVARQYLRPRSGKKEEVIIRQYQITPGQCTVKGIAIGGNSFLVKDEK